ncbi:MAG: polysaccharide biosynthesis C-terminal domain-containing protein, partial [Planctomycetales bacterium]|nr:polysaccharide biosynthesis C-terminal domain-containing protein [Planctomycetales bacterium]
ERGFAVAMVGCAFLALISGRVWERAALVSRPIGETAAGAQAQHVRFSMPIFISSLLAVVVAQTALIATGVLSTPIEAGLYAAAERFSLAAALVGQAVYLAIASRVAALHTAGDLASMGALVRKATRMVSAATLIVCIVLWLAADLLLGLYGSEFSGAVPVLRVLLLSVLVNACAGPTGQVLLMTRNEVDHLIAMAISLIVQSLLIAALISDYGVLGAAWAVLVSTLVWNGLMMYFVRHRLALNPVLV